jgi:hypothetical protein
MLCSMSCHGVSAAQHSNVSFGLSSVGNLLMSCADVGGKDGEDLTNWGDSQPLRQLRPNRAGVLTRRSLNFLPTNASASLNTFST